MPCYFHMTQHIFENTFGYFFELLLNYEILNFAYLVGAFLEKRVDYSHGFSSVFLFRYT